LKKILIFGNSGSGKSTLAKHLARTEHLAHLDLDTLAWLPGSPPERAPIEVSAKNLSAFTRRESAWVIEGCYADLLELLVTEATEMIFMNLSVEQCVENAKSRPWEPHKYPSKAAQDENLGMLIDWIKAYQMRKDEFSFKAHQALFQAFDGKKTEYGCNIGSLV